MDNSGRDIRTVIRCSKCGAELAPDMLFCVKCGCRIEQNNFEQKNFELYDQVGSVYQYVNNLTNMNNKCRLNVHEINASMRQESKLIKFIFGLYTGIWVFLFLLFWAFGWIVGNDASSILKVVSWLYVIVIILRFYPVYLGWGDRIDLMDDNLRLSREINLQRAQVSQICPYLNREVETPDLDIIMNGILEGRIRSAEDIQKVPLVAKPQEKLKFLPGIVYEIRKNNKKVYKEFSIPVIAHNAGKKEIANTVRAFQDDYNSGKFKMFDAYYDNFMQPILLVIMIAVYGIKMFGILTYIPYFLNQHGILPFNLFAFFFYNDTPLTSAYIKLILEYCYKLTDNPLYYILFIFDCIAFLANIIMPFLILKHLKVRKHVTWVNNSKNWTEKKTKTKTESVPIYTEYVNGREVVHERFVDRTYDVYTHYSDFSYYDENGNKVSYSREVETALQGDVVFYELGKKTYRIGDNGMNRLVIWFTFISIVHILTILIGYHCYGMINI